MIRDSQTRPLKTTAILCGVGALFGAMTISPAVAQEEITIEEALQICAGVRNEKDRLDCFEGLAAASKKSTQSAASQDGDEPTDDAPATDLAEDATPEFVVQDDTSDDAAESVASNTEEAVSPATSDAPTVASEDTPGAVVTAAPDEEAETPDESASTQRFVIVPAERAEELKELEKRTPGQKKKPYSATVRRAWFNGEGRMFILLTTNEVYKQIDGKKFRLPKAGDEIALRPGLVSGWFVELKKGYPSVKMSLINR